MNLVFCQARYAVVFSEILQKKNTRRFAVVLGNYLLSYESFNYRIFLFRTIFRCHNFSTVSVLCYDGIDNESTLQW